MSLLTGSAITILDVLIYLLLRANRKLVEVNEELAELRARFDSQCGARRDVMSRMPSDWPRFYRSIVRRDITPGDPRFN